MKTTNGFIEMKNDAKNCLRKEVSGKNMSER